MEKFKNLNVYTNIRRPDGNCKTKAEVLYDMTIVSYSRDKLKFNDDHIEAAGKLYDELIKTGIIEEDEYLDEDKNGYL